MNLRKTLAMFFLISGILGLTAASALVYTPGGGVFPGPLAFGIFSVVLAVVGVVFLISWMFSELAGPSVQRMAAPAQAPVESAAVGETAE